MSKANKWSELSRSERQAITASLNARVRGEKDPAKKKKGGVPEGPFEEAQLEKLTKDALFKIAKKLELDVEKKALKAELIEGILEHQ